MKSGGIHSRPNFGQLRCEVLQYFKGNRLLLKLVPCVGEYCMVHSSKTAGIQVRSLDSGRTI